MIAFSIGPINIYRYGIFYFIGFTLGYLFIKLISKHKFFSKYPRLQKLLHNETDDLFIAIILGGILGGRLGHILIYDITYYIQHPLDMLAIWKGGMSFIGGVIGAAIALTILANKKKLNRKEFRILTDTIILMVPVGIMLGRIGNYLNQELYGIVFSNDYLGLSDNIITLLKNINILHIYSQVDTNIRINTNFLSSIFEGLIGFLILLFFTIKRLYKKNNQQIGLYKPGLILGIFLTRYSLIRFLLEYLRQDSQAEFIGWFTKSQYFFIIFFLLGLFLIVKKYRHKDIQKA